MGTPISGLEQLNVDLMRYKKVRPVRMNATITPPPTKKRRVSFRENVVCQEFSPKENPNLVLNTKKSTSKPLQCEKNPKSKPPKPWLYDGTSLVNKLLSCGAASNNQDTILSGQPSLNTDSNNNHDTTI